MSGRSVALEPAHAVEVEAVTAAELSFSRRYDVAACSARRAMSSGSPSQTVQDVGGPVRGSPRSRKAGVPRAPLQVVERRVQCALRSLLSTDRAEALADVLERERVVPYERTVVVDEAQRGLSRLVVALDRAPSPLPVTPSCAIDTCTTSA